MEMGYNTNNLDSMNGWFLNELEFSRLFKLDELESNTYVRNSREFHCNRKIYSNIPKKTSGIYIYYDKNKKPLYVGKSRDLRGRHSQHMNNTSSHFTKEQRLQIIYYSFAIVENVFLRNIYEMLYIGKYKPNYNADREIKS